MASVAFTVDGATIATITAPPFMTTWTVPSSATTGTVYTITTQATDGGGLIGSASASLTVVAAEPETAAPTVTLTAPATASAGATIDLTAVATGSPTVAAVAFTVEGARLATVVTPPYGAQYQVPAGLRAGAVLHVEAEVVDGVGRTARDAQTITVQATAAPGSGVVFGRVFDDTTGLAIGGATVTLLNSAIFRGRT